MLAMLATVASFQFASLVVDGGEDKGTKRLKGQRDAALALAKRTLAEHGDVPVRRSVHDCATRGKPKHMQSFYMQSLEGEQ